MSDRPPRSASRSILGAFDFIIKLAAVVGVLSAGFLWLVEPRFKPYSEVITTVAGITETLDRISGQMHTLTERMEVLENRGSDRTPPLAFAESGNAIGNGEPGQSVIMRWAYHKTRECGAPVVDALFEVPVRGTQFPVTMRFERVGISSANGRGIALPIGQGILAFPATIPDGVPAGTAEGWLVFHYPDCLGVPPVRTPRVNFEITPRMKVPANGFGDVERG